MINKYENTWSTYVLKTWSTIAKTNAKHRQTNDKNRQTNCNNRQAPTKKHVKQCCNNHQQTK
jgi:hypothetical protein